VPRSERGARRGAAPRFPLLLRIGAWTRSAVADLSLRPTGRPIRQISPNGGANPSMETEAATVFGCVDTHTHTHYAAAVHQHGRLRGHREFPATDRGYHKLLAWMRRIRGQVVIVSSTHRPLPSCGSCASWRSRVISSPICSAAPAPRSASRTAASRHRARSARRPPFSSRRSRSAHSLRRIAWASSADRRAACLIAC
jgi:hypothetical protein